jgi:hypothetical protein
VIPGRWKRGWFSGEVDVSLCRYDGIEKEGFVDCVAELGGEMDRERGERDMETLGS